MGRILTTWVMRGSARWEALRHLAGLVAALAVGVAVVPHLERAGVPAGPAQPRAAAARLRPVAGRSHAVRQAPADSATIYFVSAQLSADAQVFDWMEWERQSMGLSALVIIVYAPGPRDTALVSAMAVELAPRDSLDAIRASLGEDPIG
jgi:hypothetical protein